MQMTPEVQIRSAVKALTDVVLPAVDPNNKLAQEQARLVIGMLNLMGEQLPFRYRFDRDELNRLVAYSRKIQLAARGGEATTSAVTQLSAATNAAQKALDGAITTPEALVDAVRTMRAATGEVVTQAYRDGDTDCRGAVRDLVLELSQAQLLRERSMYLAQGWEPDPKAIPPIATLLDESSR